MERHRERMGITLLGGLPWGFSIKGGSENNWSIVVSKLERNGKGEASGLCIGDIITCVNDVTVGGNRREAVELIRKSGHRLVLEVERDFPSSTIDTSTQERQTVFGSYISDAKTVPSEVRGNGNQTAWYNNTYEQTINFTYNEPAGHNFSETSNKTRQQEVKEKLKAVIAEKRDGLAKTLADLPKERQLEKGRRSMTSASTVSDPSESVPTAPSRSGLRHRHGRKDAERPRSWHLSKHPEVDRELRSMALSPTNKDPPIQHRSRRKSREWLESEDLRSTLDRSSADSLSGRSSEHLQFENGEPNPSPSRRNANRSRDRSSINSNPSLMEAVQASFGSHNSSIDYDHPSVMNCSSQDSLNSSSLSAKGSKADSHPAASINNVRIETSVGNKLRSSGRYGVVWKLPQVHRRAKSFDALSEDSPPEHRGSAELSRTSASSTHSESSSHRTNATPKSSSPVKTRDETREYSHFHNRGEKRKNIEALISNFSKGTFPGQDAKCADKNDSQSGSIVKRLQHISASSPSNITNTRQHIHAEEKSPSGSTRYHQTPKEAALSKMFTEKYIDSNTLQSRSDEYRKNIQGMSKKVLRVTSFTRKDLELSPPYPSPILQPKVFSFPVPITEGQEKPQFSTNGNGPVRSKSTSSLLENSVVAMVSITHQETNLLQRKQYCESLSASSVSHAAAETPPQKERLETTGENVIKRGRRSRNSVHCEENYREELSSPVTSLKSVTVKNDPTRQEFPHTPNPPTSPNPHAQMPNFTPAPAAAAVPVTKSSSPVTTLPIDVPPSSGSSSVQTTIPSTASVATYSEVSTSSSPLPATSAYYQTSASKAKIIHLVQEKVEGGEIIDLENAESEDERNKKKVELLQSITKKLSDLQRMKDSIKAEINENEHLGKTVKQLAEKLCNPREYERFKTFVEEIDKIFNLLFSISGRLARVENTLATLGESADQEEKSGLLEKKKRLSSQQLEAKSLKENADKRRETVSKILSSHMNEEQFADFEHYIKMKMALIAEQRDVDDKMKLGEEQMRELYESLPDSLQEEHSPSLQYKENVPASSLAEGEKPDYNPTLS